MVTRVYREIGETKFFQKIVSRRLEVFSRFLLKVQKRLNL